MSALSEAMIAGHSVAEWQEIARQDDCFDWMVPSDLRVLAGEIAALRAKLADAESRERAAWEKAAQVARQYLVTHGGSPHDAVSTLPRRIADAIIAAAPPTGDAP